MWFYRREYYNLIKTIHVRWTIQASRNSITESMVEDANSMRLFRIIYGTVVVTLVISYVLRPWM